MMNELKNHNEFFVKCLNKNVNLKLVKLIVKIVEVIFHLVFIVDKV